MKKTLLNIYLGGLDESGIVLARNVPSPGNSGRSPKLAYGKRKRGRRDENGGKRNGRINETARGRVSRESYVERNVANGDDGVEKSSSGSGWKANETMFLRRENRGKRTSRNAGEFGRKEEESR